MSCIILVANKTSILIWRPHTGLDYKPTGKSSEGVRTGLELSSLRICRWGNEPDWIWRKLMKNRTLGWTLKALTSSLIILVAALVSASFVHDHPGECTVSFSHLHCETDCVAILVDSFLCCNTIDSQNCCQRWCGNAKCEDYPYDIIVPPFCDPTPRTYYNPGEVFAGPCQANGRCAGTPTGWGLPGGS